jgi:hypothetical protein
MVCWSSPRMVSENATRAMRVKPSNCKTTTSRIVRRTAGSLRGSRVRTEKSTEARADFSDDASCGFTAATDKQNAGDPGLVALANNGGPTRRGCLRPAARSSMPSPQRPARPTAHLGSPPTSAASPDPKARAVISVRSRCRSPRHRDREKGREREQARRHRCGSSRALPASRSRSFPRPSCTRGQEGKPRSRRGDGGVSVRSGTPRYRTQARTPKNARPRQVDAVHARLFRLATGKEDLYGRLPRHRVVLT